MMNHIETQVRRIPIMLASILVALVLVAGVAYAAIGNISINTGGSGPSSAPAALAASATPTIPAAPANLARLAQPVVAPAVGTRGPQLVEYTLEAKEVTGQLDNGVAFTYWTFNDTVPGPMLRVREGDTVRITLKNAPGTLVAHSIDLHAVSGPGGGAAATQVSPGHTAVFEFKAEHAGTYVYHCATPPAAMHIAMGMFGLIVVEPAGGLPQVDHEYYVMQSEFYIDGQKGQPGLHGMESTAAMDKMMAEDPDYVVFNGSVGALMEQRALTAKSGETVRIFFGDAGPNLTSSFHVIGQVMTNVAVEGGSLVNHDVQTTTVAPGGATMIELQPDVPGDYMLVDHALSRVMKGAAGTLHVTGPENPSVFHVIEHGDAGTGGH